MNGAYFPERLRELRQAAGLTRTELAEKANVGWRAITNWELGLREPLWTAVIALAEALGVSVEAFLEEPARRPPVSRGRPPKSKPGAKGRGRKGRGRKGRD